MPIHNRRFAVLAALLSALLMPAAAPAPKPEGWIGWGNGDVYRTSNALNANPTWTKGRKER